MLSSLFSLILSSSSSHPLLPGLHVFCWAHTSAQHCSAIIILTSTTSCPSSIPMSVNPTLDIHAFNTGTSTISITSHFCFWLDATGKINNGSANEGKLSTSNHFLACCICIMFCYSLNSSRSNTLHCFFFALHCFQTQPARLFTT